MKNLKIIVTLFVVSLLGFTLSAQEVQLEWAKSIGGVNSDGGFSIALDNSGNAYTAGYFMGVVYIRTGQDSIQLNSVGGSADILLTKYDADGLFLWAKQMGGPMSDGSYSCAVDSEGNVYLTGYFMNTVDFDPGAGVFEMTSVNYYDIYVCKLDSSGDFLWARQIGGTGDYDYGQKLILDPDDGSLLITGIFTGSCDFDPGPDTFELSANYDDVFVLKLDADGNFTWADQMGGDGFDGGLGIAIDNNKDIFVTGVFELTADFDPGPETFYMTAPGGPLKTDGFVCKLGADGSFIWAVQMGSTGNDWANSIVVDPSGNALITGEFLFDVDFDPGPGEYQLVSQNWDAFVWKLDPDGNLIWARKMGGPDFDWGNAITVDNAGNAYTTGFFMTTADFDPGTAVFNLTAGAYWEVYISKLTAAGDFAWAAGFKGNVIHDVNTNQGWCVVVDNNDNVYSTGVFESWTDVDPGPGIYYLTAHDEGNGFYSEDCFIHKMSQTYGVGIVENSIENGFRFYPNPVKDVLTIELGGDYSSVQADVLDITGKLLASTDYSKASSIKVSMNVDIGVYIIRIKDDEGMIKYLKVIKE